ncbi:MAG: protein-L-isoaspartate(D-aspartate) O-methyltransferase [Deltaproteobacteria bacterium]|nr:protein-L-isoaspartate(D-aspartate) O-methyltransferase [Deltaproteobacteria bacterium]MBW2072252.1 protein-L-isoaspartate(D-aspartate) O-methyltransferase [Deltaproteobacteria bacterium]
MEYATARNRMVENQLISRGIKDQRVLQAMRTVPRHLFVEEALRNQAYSDHPLPIGEKQTISQPYMVALMTEALELQGDERVLEIGTGSGYQAAILAELAEKIYSIERLRSLSMRARRILDKLGYLNIVLKVGDGTIGWKEEAPFDAIIVTAGSPDVPQPLVDQLAVGGRLVIPVGDRYSQSLMKIVREKTGLKKIDLGGCRFVNLVGQHGWQSSN